MATVLGVANTDNVLGANAPAGIPPPIDPTQFWLNPFNISRSEKDALIRTLREKHPSTNTQDPAPEQEFKPQPPQPSKRPRRSSKPLVPRDNVSPERARHLERNRIAANKCRLKKKREHKQIQNVLENETAKRDTLLAEVDFLKEEMWHLKNRIFEHAKCDDQQINMQLAKMKQNVLGANSSPSKCPSPTFSISTWSDGSSVDAGAAGAGGGGGQFDLSSVSMPTEDAVYENYAEGLFDSFVDVPNL